jgi:hypothetical protein
MDDAQAIEKLASYGLEKLKKIKAAVDPGDPDMPLLDAAIGKLWHPEAGAKERNLARAGEESAAGDVAYESAKADQEPMGLMSATPSPYAPPGSQPIQLDRSMVRAGGKQALGTAAAAAQLIPGVDAAVSGIAGKPVLESAVQEAPSPFAARGAAMLVPYLGARGALGRAAQTGVGAAMKPFTAPYSRILAGAKQIMPAGTMVPHVLAGAGAAGLVAGGEAGVRRAAQALSGNEVQDLSAGELAVPILAGGGLGMLPGVAEWARKPTGILGRSGRTAARFAEADRSGTRAAVAAEESQVPVGSREPLPPEQRAVKEFKNSMEGAALETEGKFSMAHGDAETKWMKEGYAPEYQKLLENGDRISPATTLEKLDELVASKASQSAEGNDPSLLQLGRKLKALRDEFSGYLQEGATLRDYKNAIDQATALAEQSSSSPVAKKAFADVEKILREDAYSGFPGFGELSDKHKAFQANQERMTDVVYGKPEHTAEAYTGAAKQDRGRKFFSQITDETPAVTERANELANRSDYGLRSIEDMRAARAAGEKRFAEREAVESSKLIGQKGFSSPLAMGTLAAVEPSPYHVARAAHTMFTSIHPFQFARSRLAAGIDPESMRMTIPQLLGFTHLRPTDDISSIVSEARRQASQFIPQ